MQTPDAIESLGLTKLAAGVAGSLISLRFMQGTPGQRVVSFIGGVALSYFLSTPSSLRLGVKGVDGAEGVVGLLIGVFGMTIMSKVYEVLQGINSQEVARIFVSWVKRKWSA